MKLSVLLLVIQIFGYLNANVTTQNFFTGGGCATIPGIGSPILMIANANKYIEDALNIKNPYTSVKYIHFVAQQPFTSAFNLYRLGFSITDLNNTKYIGVEFTGQPFGIGTIKINKFLMTTDFNRMKQFIDKDMVLTNSFKCGDLKFAYSSFGNDPTPDLNYVFPGRNQNSTGLAILDQLNSNTAKPAKTKTCVTANFIESQNIYGTGTGTTVNDLTACLPNERAIAAIKIGCNLLTGVTMIQLVKNNLNDNGTTDSNIVGSATTTAANITTIDLNGAYSISFTGYTTGITNGLRVQTFDINGKEITNFLCGIPAVSSKNVITTVDDFLGFTSIYYTAPNITGLKVLQYKP